MNLSQNGKHEPLITSHLVVFCLWSSKNLYLRWSRTSHDIFFFVSGEEVTRKWFLSALRDGFLVSVSVSARPSPPRTCTFCRQNYKWTQRPFVSKRTNFATSSYNFHYQWPSNVAFWSTPVCCGWGEIRLPSSCGARQPPQGPQQRLSSFSRNTIASTS
jgi:hypothetical protein